MSSSSSPDRESTGIASSENTVSGRSSGPNGSDPVATGTGDAGEADNVYDVKLSPTRRRINLALALVGIVISLIAGWSVHGPTLWGLLPIGLYSVLALLGMEITVATGVAIISGVLLLRPGVAGFASLMGKSMADSITMIGLIIMLGAGVGEVLKRTGAATMIVRGVIRLVGQRNRVAVIYGIMLSCLVLVTSLGTLAGALAIAAPVLLPIAARLGFTRTATAAMMFIGGCAGLALAPFAGSNVAIMQAAKAGYLTYLINGGGPLALLSLALGPFIVGFLQRRTEHIAEERYDDSILTSDQDEQLPARARAATVAFLLALTLTLAYAIATSAETAFPLIALPFIAVITGVAGGLDLQTVAATLYRGAARLVSIFILFWLLAGLFMLIEKLAPFQVILDTYRGSIEGSSAFVFALIVALIGWVGVPGATAAQVVLLDKVFGPVGHALGVPTSTWIVVLLFASKTDTYGPFPNGNMIGAMGLGRSTNLKNMMICGWMLLVPACVMYGLMMFFQTR